MKLIDLLYVRGAVMNLAPSFRGPLSKPVALLELRDCGILTISVLQACCAVTTEYSIPSNFVRKSTALLQVKI